VLLGRAELLPRFTVTFNGSHNPPTLATDPVMKKRSQVADLTSVVIEDARVDAWPWMPLEPRRLAVAPPISWWVWVIPDRPRHTSFHQVRAIETIDEDDGPVEVVEAVCRRVWPLSSLAAAVPDNHFVLSWSADGSHAACQACVVGYSGRGSYWSRRLSDQRGPRAAPVLRPPRAASLSSGDERAPHGLGPSQAKVNISPDALSLSGRVWLLACAPSKFSRSTHPAPSGGPEVVEPAIVSFAREVLVPLWDSVESKVEQYRGGTQMLHFDTDDRNQVLAAMVLKAEWDHLAEGLLPPSRLALRPHDPADA
jgi:hypothetical protein